MVIFWRGYGILVLFVPLFALLGAALLTIALGTYEPDPARAAALVYRLGAAALALSTVLLWAVVRWRSRVAPGVDQFTFIPMRYWTPVIGLCALALFVASFVPAALTAF